MWQPPFHINLKPLKNNFQKISPLEKFPLALFFYLSKSKPEDLGKLIQFVQTHSLKIKSIQNKNYGSISMMKNANFVAQSRYAFSPIEFQRLLTFLPPNMLIVGFFYQNQIWSFSRLQKLEKNFPLLQHQYNFFRKNLQQIGF